MFVAGIGIPLLAALNGGLGRHVGSPAAAAVILFAVGLAATLPLLFADGTSALARAATAPRHLFLGGLLVAFYIVAVTAIAPRFGVGNAVFFVLPGQLVSAALIEFRPLRRAPQSDHGAARGGSGAHGHGRCAHPTRRLGLIRVAIRPGRKPGAGRVRPDPSCFGSRM